MTTKELLVKYDKAYYDNDAPEVTDAEYDALKAKYLEESGEEEYDYVPGNVSTSFKRIQHSEPITSLAKVNDRDALIKAITPLMPIIVEPKFDGLTLVIYPDRVATRGNGFEGEDITHTALMIPGVEQLMATGKTYRGEAVMPFSEFDRINDDRSSQGLELYMNPRNAAAGMLRNKDASKVQGIKLYIYEIVGDDRRKTSVHETLDHVSLRGTRPAPYEFFQDIEEAADYIIGYDRGSLDYEIDGVVVKSDQPNSLEKFGSTGHHPKNAVAYKFPSQGVWTTLKSITWQVGRTGKITPVAELDPVLLLGSTVSRATLHNISIIKALDVQVGGEVFVIKANDVIPAITDARPGPESCSVKELRSCPECSHTITKTNDLYFCTNPDCRPQAIGHLVHMAKRDALDIEGLSEETAIKILDSGRSSLCIFDMTKEDIQALPGFGPKSAENLYRNIQASRTPDLNRFLYAAGLPLIGRSACRLIAETFGDFDSLIEDHGNQGLRLKAIPGFGPAMVDSIDKFFYLWKFLSEYVTPKTLAPKLAEKPDRILTIVVTGKFEEGQRQVRRKEIEQMILDAGHKTSGSVSKKTNYVLVGKDAGSKEDKAKSLGVSIISTLGDLRSILLNA